MAFITLPHWERKVEKIISTYGVQNLVISHNPCRAFNISFDQFKDEEKLINNFTEISREMIRDGADVIILSCVNSSTYLTYKGITQVDGVPIVDGALAAIKLAEVMVDLKKAGMWKSRKTIGDDIIQGLRKGYYHGSESV